MARHPLGQWLSTCRLTGRGPEGGGEGQVKALAPIPPGCCLPQVILWSMSGVAAVSRVLPGLHLHLGGSDRLCGKKLVGLYVYCLWRSLSLSLLTFSVYSAFYSILV